MVMECKDTARKSHYPKDGPWEVPEGWVWTRLCDITELIEDCPHSTAKDEGAGFALIRTPNVGEGHLILDGVHRVSESVYNKRNTRAIPTEGDIIYAREAPAGNAAVIRKGELVCLGQRTVLIRPVKQFVDTKLLTYFILSTNSRNRLISTAVGSTAAHVNLETIRPFLIPLPPINEQKGIVVEIEKWLFIISSLQDSIASVNNTIQSTKKKILDLAIHGKLVPQDPSDEPAIELLKRINPDFKPSDNLHYLDCPSGWAVTQMKSIIELLSGRDLDNSRCNSEGYGVPYLVGASCIDKGRINTYRWTETPEVISKEGDVLLSCKGTVGEVVLNTMGNLHIARQFMAIRSKAPQYILPDYLGIIIKASIETLKKAARGIIPGISREDILGLTVMIPPSEEQQRILSRIAEFNQSVSLIVANTCN